MLTRTRASSARKRTKPSSASLRPSSSTATKSTGPSTASRESSARNYLVSGFQGVGALAPTFGAPTNRASAPEDTLPSSEVHLQDAYEKPEAERFFSRRRE